MRPKNLPHAAHDHDSTPVRTRSKSTHVSLATTSPRPRDSLDRAHRPPPQSSREVTYIGARSIERRANGATRFSLDRTTTSSDTNGRRPVDDAPIHSMARVVREKAHKGETRTNARATRKKTTRRDATRHETYTRKKPTRRRGFPARARERPRRASPTEDVPALCSSPNKTSRSPEQTSPGRRRKHAPSAKTKKQKTKHKKTKRQRGFPACSQASTNAPQAGLSSLFRWGRLIFCWCERLMGGRARRVSIIMTTCIGRDTLMGHF